MTAQIDVLANRAGKSWGLRTQLARVLWATAQPAFRYSPRPFWGWRRMLLRVFGARIGAHVRVHPTARITMPWHLRIDDQAAVGDCAILYALGPILIGERATISQNAHLCAGTHDLSQPSRPLVKAAVRIGADAWVCADAFVGPHVHIGAGAVLGARAVAMKSLGPGETGVGNPMQVKGAQWTR